MARSGRRSLCNGMRTVSRQHARVVAPAIQQRNITTTFNNHNLAKFALVNNTNNNNNNNVTQSRSFQTSRAYYDLPDHEVISVPALSPTMEQGK